MARRIAWVALAVALAAAALYAARGPSPLAPLPAYELSLVGDQSRGAPAQLRADTIRVHPGSRVQIVARPVTAPEGAVEARAFVLRGGAAERLGAPIEIADGVARLAGDAGAIFPAETGDWDVILAVGRPAALPTEANVVAMLGGTTGAVRIVRAHVVVVGER